MTNRVLPLLFAIQILILDAVFASAKNIPDHLRVYLQKDIQLEKREIYLVQAGQSVAKSLATNKREELAIFGMSS